jgi:hypothetical protein
MSMVQELTEKLIVAQLMKKYPTFIVSKCHQNTTSGLYPEPSAHFLKIQLNVILYSSGSQSGLHRSQRIHDQFPRDPWMHFCNGNAEVYIFF